MTDLVVAVGLVLAIEGALYAAVPHTMKRFMAQAQSLPDTVFRTAGMAALIVGVVIVWLVRG